jgi:uncharacterized protein YjiS (DUF1127 family)
MPCAGPNYSCNSLLNITSPLGQMRPGETDAQASIDARTYFLRRVLNAVREYFQHRKQRRDLAALDEHLLRDVGITPRDAEAEARTPFWKI